MKYSENFLGSNAYFQEMIESQLQDLNQLPLLKESSLKEFKSINFSLQEQIIVVKLTHRSGEVSHKEINHPNVTSVALDFDDMAAYFDPQKVEQLPLNKSDYPQGLDYEFLSAKEPELVSQVVLLNLLNNHCSLEQILQAILP